MELNYTNCREIEHDGFRIKIYCTTTEHAKQYGLESNKPLFVKDLYVEESKRNKGYGKQLLEMVEDFASSNECDLIFGHIPEDVNFTKDERPIYHSDRTTIKYWLHERGYSVNNDNYDFHKILKVKKPLKYYGGIGFDNCSELGSYEIISEYEKRFFTNLSEAKEHYLQIKGEKAIWDLKENELLDAWYRI